MGATANELAGAHRHHDTGIGVINMQGGDRDSAGLFQQRPSCGWGSAMHR